MTSETRERIKQYEGALPHIKEKITAAAVLLVIAMTIMVTATYAWITLSTSPEVTSIDTTVAANGALEIAMANGTGAAPGRSAAGDSTGKDNNVVRANNTWGNLVNLSDPSYGLAMSFCVRRHSMALPVCLQTPFMEWNMVKMGG